MNLVPMARRLWQHLNLAIGCLDAPDLCHERIKLLGTLDLIRFQVADTVDDGLWFILDEFGPQCKTQWVGKEALPAVRIVLIEDSFEENAVVVEVSELRSCEAQHV